MRRGGGFQGLDAGSNPGPVTGFLHRATDGTT